MDEIALLARIAAKDQGAFEAFYRRYERPLFGYLFNFVGNRAWVEELVSDVMLAVWKEAAEFRGVSKVSTWLFGIARHKALSLLRRQPSMGDCVTEDEQAAETLASPDPDPGEALKERSERLWEAVQSLSPEHREVLRLVLIDNLSYPGRSPRLPTVR